MNKQRNLVLLHLPVSGCSSHVQLQVFDNEALMNHTQSETLTDNLCHNKQRTGDLIKVRRRFLWM